MLISRTATRKRRRRTRGWAGLPADPPGPPRFPSETTIDESKAFLSLDNRLYRDIRSRFQRICEEADIIKKTIAGPERWEGPKDWHGSAHFRETRPAYSPERRPPLHRLLALRRPSPVSVRKSH